MVPSILIAIVLGVSAIASASSDIPVGALLEGVAVPPKYNRVKVRDVTPIDKWLFIRQACTPGYATCSDQGCCLGVCCTGGGCCDAGYTCATISGLPGCCPVGQSCTSIAPSQCVNVGYVACSGDTFCCPAGSICSRDTLGNPQCTAGGSTLAVPNAATIPPAAAPVPTAPALSSLPGAANTPPSVATVTVTSPGGSGSGASSGTGTGSGSGSGAGKLLPGAAGRVAAAAAAPLALIPLGLALIL